MAGLVLRMATRPVPLVEWSGSRTSIFGGWRRFDDRRTKRQQHGSRTAGTSLRFVVSFADYASAFDSSTGIHSCAEGRGQPGRITLTLLSSFPAPRQPKAGQSKAEQQLTRPPRGRGVMSPDCRLDDGCKKSWCSARSLQPGHICSSTLAGGICAVVHSRRFDAEVDGVSRTGPYSVRA